MIKTLLCIKFYLEIFFAQLLHNQSNLIIIINNVVRKVKINLTGLFIDRFDFETVFEKNYHVLKR